MTQIASASSVTLKVQNARGLARFCLSIAEPFEELGKPFLAHVAREMSRLCLQVAEKRSLEFSRKADSLLKKAMKVLEGGLEDPKGSSDDSHRKTTTPKKSNVPQRQSSQKFLSFGKAENIIPASRISKGLEENFSVFIANDTPGTLIDRQWVSPIREQLTRWVHLGVGQLPRRRLELSFRYVVDRLWVELRFPKFGQTELPSGLVAKFTESDAKKTEVYLDRKNTLICRACYFIQTPAFLAYEILVSGRKFLVPASDVVDSVPKDPQQVRELTGSRVLKSLQLKETFGQKQRLHLLWREQKYVSLWVDRVEGPHLYLTHHFQPFDFEKRGSAGVFSLEDGGRAVVLDLYPWLERIEKPVHEEKKGTESYRVFRIAGRRYGVPSRNVLEEGQIRPGDWLRRKVGGAARTYPLIDFKTALNLNGESGGCFIALKWKGESIAWAVDAIEPRPLEDVDPRRIRSVQVMGSRSQGSIIRGILSDFGSFPLYLVNLNRLFS